MGMNLEKLGKCVTENFNRILFQFGSVPRTLEDTECLQLAGNKPATESSCNVGKKCPQWHTGPWKAVSSGFR